MTYDLIKNNLNKYTISDIIEENKDELSISWFTTSSKQDFESFLDGYDTSNRKLLENKYKNEDIIILEINQGKYLERIKTFKNDTEVVNWLKTYF